MMTFHIMTFIIMTFNIMTCSIITFFRTTISILCRYAECRLSAWVFIVMLSVLLLFVVMLSVVVPCLYPLGTMLEYQAN
jgi:hypothetical protein